MFATQTAFIAPAAAATVGSAPCIQIVDNPTGVIVTQVGNDCVVKFTSGTVIWTMPTGVSALDVLAVGGGGGGGGDGGAGGGGGEIRSATRISPTSTSVTISIGEGGAGGSWFSSTTGLNGSETTISGGLAFTANGGIGGGGWQNTTGGAGGSGGSGGSGTNGQQGGGGPANCTPFGSIYLGQSPSGVVYSDLITGATQDYGGGGGGGFGAETNNAGDAQLGAAGGGTNSGGRGANYKLEIDGVTAINGASAGQAGFANTGGGGGGGSACNAEGAMAAGRDGVTQRTAGGNGGSGVVILRYNIPSINAPTINSVTATSTSQLAITFTGPSTTGSGVTGFRVDYSTDGLTWTTDSSSVAADATSYTISDLTAGTNYYVRVAAIHANGLGAWGYPWLKIYETRNPKRDVSNLIQYVSGYGIGTNDAAAQNASTPFTRVRYEMESTYNDGINPNAKYVYADFARQIGTFANGTATANSSQISVATLRVPTTGTDPLSATANQFEIQANVSDLTILSNVADVENGNGFSGRLEIWPWNYQTNPTTPFAERSSLTYDDADTYVRGAGSLYGSFQLHRIGAVTKTVFAWNAHFASNPDIGFGNNTTIHTPSNLIHSDWTFIKDSTNYTTTGLRSDFRLGTYINAPTSTLTTYTITFAAGTDGTGTNATLTKTEGTSFTLPDSATANSYFTRSGFEVVGWSTSDGGAQTHSLGGGFTTDATTTLYPVWKATQSITFASPTAMSVATGAQTVAPTSSSGLTVALTSTTTGICTVSGFVITAVADGICSITASQIGNATYSAAPAVTRTFDVDSVAPTLNTPSDTSSADAITITFSSSESGTYYYLVNVPTDPVPNANTVIDPGLASVALFGSAPAASGSNSIVSDYLTPGVNYTIYIVVKDAAGNVSNVANLAFTWVLPPDTTAPTITSPSSGGITRTTTNLTFTTDEAGTFFYLVRIATDAAPNAAAVIAQGAAAAKGTANASIGENVVSIAGLTAGTSYVAYLVVRDSALNASVVSSISFTTSAPPPAADSDDRGSGPRVRVPPVVVVTPKQTPTTPVSQLVGGTTIVVNPGKGMAVIDGVIATETVQVLATQAKQVKVNDVAIEITSVDPDNQVKSINSNLMLQFEPSGRAKILGNGLNPNSTVIVWLLSNPTKLGEVIVKPDGSFDVSLLIPDNFPVGNHTLQLNGVTAKNQIISTSIGVVVVAKPIPIQTQPTEPTIVKQRALNLSFFPTQTKPERQQAVKIRNLIPNLNSGDVVTCKAFSTTSLKSQRKQAKRIAKQLCAPLVTNNSITVKFNSKAPANRASLNMANRKPIRVEVWVKSSSNQ